MTILSKVFSHKKPDLITKYSQKYDIPPELIKAIILTESSNTHYAVRAEKHFKYLYKVDEFARGNRVSKDTEEWGQKTSWGAMQIMGATARELGFTGRFFTELCGEPGIHYGCKYLKRQYNRYGDWNDAISSYNQGSNRKKNGKYKNQDYVNKVLKYMKEVS